VAGEATPAYQQPSLSRAPLDLCAHDEGVVRVARHLVFIRPNAFVRLDEVETEQPAAIQFLLHAENAFEIDSGGRIASLDNGPARATVYWLDPGPVRITQTDQFSVRPERVTRGRSAPNQWHLTADFAATGAQRRLLTVIVVSRAGQCAGLPDVERLTEADTLGVRIGEATVEFRFCESDVVVECGGPACGSPGTLSTTVCAC